MFNSNPYINAALGIAMALFASGTTAMPMYHLLTETDPGQITNNLVLSQFDTLTDLINLTPAGTSGLPSLPGAVSARGLVYVPASTVPEPATIMLYAIGLAGLGIVGRRKTT